MQGGERRLAEPALGLIVDPLEGQVVIRLRDAAQIGERVANFGPFVEARAADHSIRKAERDEALLEFAHLEGSADEDGDVVQRDAGPLGLLDRFADDPGFLLAVPNPGHSRARAHRGVSEQGLAEPALIVSDKPRSDREYVAA